MTAGDTQPTLGFQRVLQRAVYHVQSSGKKEVTGRQRWWRSSARRIRTRSITSTSRMSPAWTW